MTPRAVALLQLVSEQTMPNVLATLGTAPRRQVLLHTPRTRPHAGWIVAAIARSGLDVESHLVELTEAPDLQETGRAVRVAAEQCLAAGLQPLLNFTGGTKLMSIGAFAAAHATRIGSFYFDTDHRTTLSGHTGPLPAPCDQPASFVREAAARLSVDLIAAAHGVHRVTPGRDPAPWRPLARLLRGNPKLEEACHRFVVGLDEGLHRPADYLRLLDTPLDHLPEPLVEPLALASFIVLREGQWHLAFDRRAELEAMAAPSATFRPPSDYFALIAPLQQLLSFLGGGWWEIAVLDDALHSGRFTDLRWSPEVTRRPDGPSQEEDILAVEGLNLAVFSCKRGGDRARLLRAFEELDSGARSLGGSMARRFLCIALPVPRLLTEEVNSRAAAGRTTLVGPVTLLNPRRFDPIPA